VSLVGDEIPTVTIFWLSRKL